MRRKKKSQRKWKQNSCEGKIDFKSVETAEKAAARLNSKKTRDGYHELEAYQCLFCKGWHIGRKYTPA
jgi:predicted DNA-binding WGR domain protein